MQLPASVLEALRPPIEGDTLAEVAANAEEKVFQVAVAINAERFPEDGDSHPEDLQETIKRGVAALTYQATMTAVKQNRPQDSVFIFANLIDDALLAAAHDLMKTR
jgi:hypothetical protein